MHTLSFHDPLYCLEDNSSLQLQQQQQQNQQQFFDTQTANPTEEEWSEVLTSLLSKQHKPPSHNSNSTYIDSARADAISWILNNVSLHNFTALTALLAVHYLDRCFMPCSNANGLRIHEDKPWMARLAALACLSLAAKVEETRVPLLLDLQALHGSEGEGELVFDCKTVRRMELLVLSVLGWRMSPVTPLGFVNHLLLRLKMKDGFCDVGELVRRCEVLLLNVISDSRWVQYSASAWAAAALLHVTGTSHDIAGGNAEALQYHETQQLIALLSVPMVKVEECYHLILQSMSCCGTVSGHKRKHSFSSVLDYHFCYFPPSPEAVTGSCFSYEDSSSNEYATMWPSSASSSPEIRPFKMPNCAANEALNGEGITEGNNIFGWELYNNNAKA